MYSAKEMKKDPSAALYELERMKRHVNDIASQLFVLKSATHASALRSALSRAERLNGEDARIPVCDLRTDVFETCEEANVLDRLAEEAWDTAEWLDSIRTVLEEHLDQ